MLILLSCFRMCQQSIPSFYKQNYQKPIKIIMLEDKKFIYFRTFLHCGVVLLIYYCELNTNAQQYTVRYERALRKHDDNKSNLKQYTSLLSQQFKTSLFDQSHQNTQVSKQEEIGSRKMHYTCHKCLQVPSYLLSSHMKATLLYSPSVRRPMLKHTENYRTGKKATMFKAEKQQSTIKCQSLYTKFYFFCLLDF